MNSRASHPEHFFAAVEHGLLLLAAGSPTEMLSTMSRGASRRGLADAAMGYDHVRLMMLSCDQEVES